MLTSLIFGQTLWHDFINYDDPRYVYENTNITSGIGISGIAWAFSHVHAMNWHPLTTISHMLDCQLYGLKAGGHHFTNVLLHTLAAILLFLALRQMTGAFWPSAFVAAVFAIHPLRVESVAWIAERKDVLSGVIFMLTLLAYVHYTRAPSFGRYLAVAVVFTLGLLSKPMLVTLPFVLLLLDYWPLRRIGAGVSNVRTQVLTSSLEKIPLLALSAISSVVTFIAQKAAVGWTEELPIFERITNAVVSYVLYIWQMLWPFRLAVFYPHPENRLPLWEIISSFLLLICITAGSHRFAKTTALFNYRLVVVCGNARAGDRPGASRLARAGRQIHILTPDRFIHSSYVGSGRSDSFVATSAHSLDHCRNTYDRCLELARVDSDQVLARQRNPVQARARRDDKQRCC